MSRLLVAIPLCGFLVSIPAVPQAQSPPSAPQTATQAQPPAAPPKPAAQSKPDQPESKFTGGVTEVIVPVTVKDDRGKFVSNLEAKDFRVTDEGRPQRVTFFSHQEKQPVVIGFLVDLSNSSRIHWNTFQDAILELVWNLLPGDPRYSGYLISYANEAELQVNTTTDSEKLAEKIRKMKPGGGAALFDALYKSCTTRSLVKGEPYEPRRIVIVIGDGHNNVGTHGMGEVLELAQRNLVTIYAISTMAFGFSNEDQDVLERLTTETGGHVEYPLNNLYKDVSGYLSNPSDAGNYALTVGTGGYAAEISKGIFNAISGISGEITTQYVLRYTPDVDPEARPKLTRKIKVDIPDLPNVKMAYRTYYYPNPVPGVTPSGGN
ncbi:MAG TPA: VWA domain-containing protein [Bryobacteraceae bacterium]|nr:VWA domain-containing protein [Bryobacteraceae bacterium]